MENSTEVAKKNAAQLFLADGKPTRAWYCLECGIVHPSEDAAEKCCTTAPCEECAAALPKNRRYFKTCQDCERKIADRKYQEKLAKAELVTDYDGYIYTGEVTGLQDGYFESVQALIDEVEDGDEDGPRLPAFAFCCNSEPPKKIDADDVIKDTFSDSCEDAADNVAYLYRQELQVALDKFYESVRWIVSFTPDYRRKVAVPFMAEVKP